jgi:dihydrofolate reductase
MINTIIAAMAENRVIGRNGLIPWDLPADRRHFRELTMGHPLIMGRRTFESIGEALPGRRTIVITRQADYRATGCLVVNDLAAALAACAAADEVFVCGGEDLYREALARADRIQLTVIHREIAGDAYFPEMPGAFREVGRLEIAGPLPYAFVRYERQ